MDATVPPDPHPTPAELAAFHTGDLPADAIDRVAAHLEGCPQCEAVLERMDGQTKGAAEAVRGAAGLHPAEAAGDLIAGRYRLVEPLGEGGMGTVWRAEQVAPVRRPVAVKLVKAGMDSKAVLRRFEAERQALALMDHPHIAKVLDAGATDRGRPFFAMELVAGVPITQHCDARRLTPRQRLELFVPVCQAVQHAHQKGVIHRDIKPSNVLVAEVDGRPVAKVIDFGVAKAVGAALTDQTLLTGVGAVIGTAEYMAPEQAGGDPADVDTRADVYALGVLLYELLTGSTPITRQRLKQAALLEVLRLVREEEPPPPSSRLSTADALPSIAASRQTEPRRLTGLVRGDLDWIVLKALEKDRGRRYETANGFAADVARYLADEPVEAGKPSATYRLRKLVRRNRGAVLAAGLLLAAILAGAGASVWQALRATAAEAATGRERDAARQAEAVAAAERDNARTAATQEATARATAEAVADFMRQVFAQGTAGGQTAPGRPVSKELTVRAAMDFAAANLGQRFAGRPEVEVAARTTFGQTYRDLGLYPEAAAQLEAAAALGRRALGPAHPDTLKAVAELGVVSLHRGDHPAAERLLAEAVAGLRRELGGAHPATLSAISDLGAVYNTTKRPAEAEPLYREALAGRRAALGPDDRDTLGSVSNLANLLRNQGRFAEAEPLMREALAGLRKARPPHHPDILGRVTNLGTLYLARGRYADSEPLLIEARVGYQTVYTAGHPAVLGSTLNLANLYRYQDRLAEAEPLFRDVLAGYRSLHKTVHQDTLRAAVNLGDLYVAMRRYADAEPLLAEALAGRRGLWGDAHPDTVAAMIHLADLYHRLGRAADARRQYQAAVLAAERLPPGGDGLPTARAGLGLELLAAGELEAAEPQLTGAYEGLRSLGNAHVSWVQERLGEVAGALARLYRRAGKPVEADRWQAERAKYPAEPAPPPRPVN